mgnify:CR=1 FL=1
MLYFSVGMPQSGKSTVAAKWRDLVQCNKYQHPQDVANNNWWWTINNGDIKHPVIVNGDDFRLATHGQVYRRLSESIVWGHVHVAIQALLLTGHTVFFDETNSSEWSIRRIFEIDANAVPVFVNTPKETCIARAIEKGQDDLVPVIERVSENLKIMTPERIEEIRREYVKPSA